MEKNNEISPIIRQGYVDAKGNRYDNIREIAYTSNNMSGNFGKYITESQEEQATGFSYNNEPLGGAIIYQNKIDKSIGLKIYKNRTNEYDDHMLISKLIKQQPQIKYSDFPTGVVTKDGKIIGQEIRFYENAITLYEYCQSEIAHDRKNIIPTNLYLKILKIVRELYDNGIFYLDGHCKNFVLIRDNHSDNMDGRNLMDYDVKLVDYQLENMIFGELSERQNERLFNNLIGNCISYLNHQFGINNIVGKVPNCSSLNELEEIIYDHDYKLTNSQHYNR